MHVDLGPLGAFLPFTRPLRVGERLGEGEPELQVVATPAPLEVVRGRLARGARARTLGGGAHTTRLGHGPRHGRRRESVDVGLLPAPCKDGGLQ